MVVSRLLAMQVTLVLKDLLAHSVPSLVRTAFQAPQGRLERRETPDRKASWASTALEFLVWLDLLGPKVHQARQALMVLREIEECGALLVLLATNRKR